MDQHRSLREVEVSDHCAVHSHMSSIERGIWEALEMATFQRTSCLPPVTHLRFGKTIERLVPALLYRKGFGGIKKACLRKQGP